MASPSLPSGTRPRPGLHLVSDDTNAPSLDHLLLDHNEAESFEESPDDVEMQVVERAWGSAIWYEPR